MLMPSRITIVGSMGRSSAGAPVPFFSFFTLAAARAVLGEGADAMAEEAGLDFDRTLPPSLSPAVALPLSLAPATLLLPLLPPTDALPPIPPPPVALTRL